MLVTLDAIMPLSEIVNIPLCTLLATHGFLYSVLKFLKPVAIVAVLVYLQLAFPQLHGERLLGA